MLDFLSYEELCAFTGYRRRSAQLRWLQDRGIRAFVSATGAVHVLRAIVVRPVLEPEPVDDEPEPVPERFRRTVVPHEAPEVRARACHHSALRRARKLGAVPRWADRKALFAVFLEAQHRSLATGELHEVDHVVPLRHQKVCGLHVEANLRVIRAIDNRRKASSHAPHV